MNGGAHIVGVSKRERSASTESHHLGETPTTAASTKPTFVDPWHRNAPGIARQRVYWRVGSGITIGITRGLRLRHSTKGGGGSFMRRHSKFCTARWWWSGALGRLVNGFPRVRPVAVRCFRAAEAFTCCTLHRNRVGKPCQEGEDKHRAPHSSILVDRTDPARRIESKNSKGEGEPPRGRSSIS